MGSARIGCPGKQGAPQNDSSVAPASEREGEPEPTLEVENQVEVDAAEIVTEGEAGRRLPRECEDPCARKLLVSAIN